MPGSHSYATFLHLSDNIEPGEKKRLHKSVGTLKVEENYIRVFTFFESQDETTESGYVDILRESPEANCYYSVLRNYPKRELLYLKKVDRIAIDKCLKK